MRSMIPSPEKAQIQRTARICGEHPQPSTPRNKLFTQPKPEPSLGKEPNRLTILQTNRSDFRIESISKFGEGSSPEVMQGISSSNKVEINWFSLVEDGMYRVPTREEHKTILQAFPSATGVGIFIPMVVVRFSKLPSKPWPLSVAGLPVVFTTDAHSVGYDRGKLGGSRTRFLDDHDARQKVSITSFLLLRGS